MHIYTYTYAHAYTYTRTCTYAYILSEKQQVGWSEKYGVIYTPFYQTSFGETAQFQLSVHIAELDQILHVAKIQL